MSTSSRENKKRTKALQKERRLKLEMQDGGADIGRIVSDPSDTTTTPNFTEFTKSTFDRSSSDASTGSLLYNKTPSVHSPHSQIATKTSSLIFPTGVEKPNNLNLKKQINRALNVAEETKLFFKKRLLLDNLKMSITDIPLKDLIQTDLGNTLHKLSLTGNRLGGLPPKLVQNLPNLKHLDLKNAELHQLPDAWHLPKLKTLNLSHNLLTEFPEESVLEGLPDLNTLNLYGNNIAEIILPTSNRKILQKLETLDLGYNELIYLPDELDQVKSLRHLKVVHNCLQTVSMRICEMDLKTIEVSSNPITEPPSDDCERGVCTMRRYWRRLITEDQKHQKTSLEIQRKQEKSSRSNWRRKQVLPKPSSVVPPAALRKAISAGAGVLEGAARTLREPATVAQKSASSLPENIDRNLKTLRRAEETMNVTSSVRSVPERSLISDPSIDSVPGEFLPDEVSVNDTLKVIFVGMAMVGKTSMIRRLIRGQDAEVPRIDERTVGVDIYQWEPKEDQRFANIDSRILLSDKLAEACGDVDVKFSVWDFAGQHVYHATHELFFSNRALYVLVWDMGATNPDTFRKKRVKTMDAESGAFKLYDSSDDESDAEGEEDRRADAALERDVDEKVQFWVDCIQTTAPGSVILPVASFDDAFKESGGVGEAQRRCRVLKQRLQRHEIRRMNGLRERLQSYKDQNRADDIAAVRLRNLMCSYTRPKIVFGDDDDSVVRVSGTKYTGFERLTQKIVDIATGRNKGSSQNALFTGHVGVRIPSMRLEVRQAVRAMRKRFKVVEWGYFINTLKDQGLTSVEDISDDLHFLANTGELSYFGEVMPGKKQSMDAVGAACPREERRRSESASTSAMQGEDEDDDMDEDEAATRLSIDDTSITMPMTSDGSTSTFEDYTSRGLSQFVFLNPVWLVEAVACILRHDLDREIKETKRIALAGGQHSLNRTASFYDAHLNCPVITTEDACMLWEHKKITKKVADRALEYSSSHTVTPFEFLQMLLIRFGVFVPIDLSIDKVLFGGREYQELVNDMMQKIGDDDPCGESTSDSYVVDVGGPADSERDAMNAKFFFLPSLLGPGEPTDAWTYKSIDSWKTTLCHSILFPDGVPTGLMERLTASVLSAIYSVSNRALVEGSVGTHSDATYEGRLVIREILCWRNAFYLKIGTIVKHADGSLKESLVEIFTHLASRKSNLCVGSASMGEGMVRLITSGRGQVGNNGRKIWKGGYLLVCKCIQRVMAEYQGVEFQKQMFCPDCLARKAVSEASFWGMSVVRSAISNNEDSLRCQYGHRVDTGLIAGPFMPTSTPRRKSILSRIDPFAVRVQAIKSAVVVVGLWDGKTRKVVRVGSGFIADRKRGLIVTAAHTLINIWGDRNFTYGENYYGLARGKVVVGVIPNDEEDGLNTAVFRYFAKIVAKDKHLRDNECHVDACVLQISTRMENDVAGDGSGCGDQPEILLENDTRALRNEKLLALKMTENCELEEQVRIVGYNQGGEGLLGPGQQLNRDVDVANGYVCMKFTHSHEMDSNESFKPNMEIVAICPTIGGHSGGPCINQDGEVIGILSRADPAETQRCYLVPASELKSMLSSAKKLI